MSEESAKERRDDDLAETEQLEDRDLEAEAILQRIRSFRRFVVVCAECQTEAPVDWHYCSNCGNRLSTECPGCGLPLPPYGGRFCPHCGLLIPRIGAKPEQE